jgi:hypothetical protein
MHELRHELRHELGGSLDVRDIVQALCEEDLTSVRLSARMRQDRAPPAFPFLSLPSFKQKGLSPSTSQDLYLCLFLLHPGASSLSRSLSISPLALSSADQPTLAGMSALVGLSSGIKQGMSLYKTHRHTEAHGRKAWARSKSQADFGPSPNKTPNKKGAPSCGQFA